MGGAGERPHPARPPGAGRAPRLGGPGRPLPETLLWNLIAPSGGYTPDFVTPPPAGLSADLARELAGLRATPAALIREHLDLIGPDLPPPVRELHADPARGLARLADEISSYWAAAIAPDWPRMCALLDAEVQRRARRLAEGGSAALLNDLHPQVSWQAGLLAIDQPHCAAPDVPHGTGLVLIPSVFVWPSVLTVTAGPIPQLAYPARGVATLWERSSRSAEPLVALLGRGRAALLQELVAPLSTTELSRRTGLTPGGVSQHLTTLRAAGLVVTHRQGRSLLNTRTEVAEALLAASS
ncbi:ArsR/SmtB family transcription factor [Paractinoplanes durhamensis]|uniref:ArsR/SmtB family transcription factor n=1 Tax=Paractinoplanes durhamensis TaxID=113563 RepID=UPI00363D5320